MPTFDDAVTTSAAPEDVWMLLYDPMQFPQWWSGVATTTYGGDGDYTMFVDGYPDFPMAQQLDTAPEGNRVTISCMVSDIKFQWRLEPLPDGTRISVHVDVPEREAARLQMQRGIIEQSLHRLAALAQQH